MKSSTYLFIDLACICVPFICSFYTKHPFYKDWKYFLPANLLVSLIYLIWDAIFTELKIWGFNPDYLIGIQFWGLPIEEILFFFCIPYACTFTYFALNWLLPRPIFHSKQKTGFWLLLFISIVGMTLYWDKSYTFCTFILMTFLLILCKRKSININGVLLSYIFILPFFFLSNGILTGSFLDAPIVWYNDDENMGLRIFTIPIEDAFYGLGLIMSNILLYRAFKYKKNS